MRNGGNAEVRNAGNLEYVLHSARGAENPVAELFAAASVLQFATSMPAFTNAGRCKRP